MKPTEGQSTEEVQREGSGLGLRNLALRFVVFMALWLILSGRFDAEHLAFGLISVLTVLIINRPVWRSPVEVDVDQDRWEFAPTRVRPWRFFVYVFWLVKEIFLANLQVAYLVLRPKKQVSPVLLGFRVGLRSPIARVTLGNSITLTPGTLTLEIQEDWFLVHALDERTTASLVSGAMQRRVAEVYGYTEGLVGEARFFGSVEEIGR